MSGTTNPCDFQLRTRLIFGENTISRLGELAKELHAQRVLLVTDPGVVAAGHAVRAKETLESAGVNVVVFDGVQENPTTREIDACLDVAQSATPELIVGLGGGSSLDTAKGCNFLLTNGGRMEDYRGMGKATRPMLPMIALPTTAGTGSECQSSALITDEVTHEKMACLDAKATPCIAILDPTLTVTQPRHVTAATGMDAIAHAVETWVTKRRSAISALFSVEAFKRLVHNIPRVLGDPQDLDARGEMLLGAAFAGIAIENSMLGAAHSTANPLTARYGIVHGEAVGMMLPHVVRFNSGHGPTMGLYAALATGAGLTRCGDSLSVASEALVTALESLLSLSNMPRSLEECGVPKADLPLLAQEAARQWTAEFNPRPVTPQNFLAIYESAYRG